MKKRVDQPPQRDQQEDLRDYTDRPRTRLARNTGAGSLINPGDDHEGRQLGVKERRVPRTGKKQHGADERGRRRGDDETSAPKASHRSADFMCESSGANGILELS